MSDINGFIERANLLLNQGRPGDAETWIKKVLETEPENHFALSILARSYMDRNDFDKGINILQQTIALDPEEAYYYYLLAFAYYRKQNNQSALQYIHSALELNPYAAEYFGLLAYIHLDERAFQLALDKANEGLAIDAENITCLNARSSALNKLRRTDEAIATMQDTLAKDPDNEFTHATMGWNYLEKGKHKEATRHFREALRLSPDHHNAKTGLKEALKSKIPPYKWLLQFNFWLQNKGKNFRWIFLVGILIGVRVIDSLTKGNKDTENIGIIVGGAYFLFVATSWIINPLANAFLLFHKDGKHALEPSEKWNAIGFMSCVLAGILFLLITSSLTVRDEQASQFIIAGLILLSLCIPVGHMQFPLRFKGNKVSQWLAMALLLLGILAPIGAIISEPIAMVVFVSYLAVFVIYTWSTAL